MSLFGFVCRRAVAAAVLVAVVSTGVLVLTRLAPGDATTMIRVSGADQATIDRLSERLGLKDPPITQIRRWMAGLVHFDLGRSYEYDAPVGALAREHVANTARLAAAALLIALLGVPLGVLTGARPAGWLSVAVTPIAVALISCPPILGALGLLWLAVVTGWFSVAPGSLSVPALALALPLAATIERIQSQAISDAMRAPDVVAAVARGLSTRRVVWRYALRQSFGPLLGIAGVLIGGLFSGSLAVEVITGWPGLGRLMYNALTGRDVFLAAGCALVGAIVLAFANLAADVARAIVDPRVRVV